MSCSPAACRPGGHRGDQGERRQGDLLRAGAGAGQEADALGRRRAGDRGHGGRRPHRPGLDLRAGAGNPAALADDMPVFVAGGIGRGEAIAGYLEMGAVGVQLGTRFACAHRMHRPPQVQEGLLPRQGARRDRQGPDRPAPAGDPGPRAQEQREENFAAKQREVARLLDEGAIEMAEAQLQIEHYWAGALRRAVIDGDVESGSVMAGQSVGMVTAKSRSPRSSANSPTKPPRRWRTEASRPLSGRLRYKRYRSGLAVASRHFDDPRDLGGRLG